MKQLLPLVILLVFGYSSVDGHANSNLKYEITDMSGNDVATGRLDKNTSLAINVPTGFYTVRITGDDNYQAIKNIIIDEAEEITTSSELSTGSSYPANIKNVSTGYIVVKVDNNGAFTCKKLLL